MMLAAYPSGIVIAQTSEVSDELTNPDFLSSVLKASAVSIPVNEPKDSATVSNMPPSP